MAHTLIKEVPISDSENKVLLDLVKTQLSYTDIEDERYNDLLSVHCKLYMQWRNNRQAHADETQQIIDRV